MVLEFTYTLDDYVEAARAHAAGPKLEVNGRRFPRNVLVGVLIIGLATALFILSPKPPPAGGPAPPPAPVGTPTFARQLLPAMPAPLVISFVWFLYSQRVRRPRHHQERRKSFLYAAGNEPRRRPQNTWAAAFLALARNYQLGESAAAPPAAVVGGGGRIGRDQRRCHAGRAPLERLQPRLRDIQPVPALTSDHAFHMVPKRAFGSEEDVRSFREVVRRTIADRPAPGFPVVRVAGGPTG